jgi:hypothetical protein
MFKCPTQLLGERHKYRPLSTSPTSNRLATQHGELSVSSKNTNRCQPHRDSHSNTTTTDDETNNSSSIHTEVLSAEFLLFPKLPIELRLKIWGYVPDPRIGEVVWETG